MTSVPTTKHKSEMLSKPSTREPLRIKKTSFMDSVLQHASSNDARSKLQAQIGSQVSQLNSLLGVNHLQGGLTDKKPGNKKIAPLQGLNGLNKLSNQASQRSLRVAESEPRAARRTKAGASAKIDRWLKLV